VTDVGARLASRLELPEDALSETAGGGYARACLDLPRERWVEAVTAARDDAETDCGFFDWLTGVDLTGADGDGGVSVVAHLWSLRRRHGVLLRTALPAGDLVLASVVGVYAGAAWHERETYEMFGVVFDGHPDLKPLLLPDGFSAHPLRKDFVLAARVAKAWPGAKDPGESESGAPSRRRMRPPGVPEPSEWGPEAEERRTDA
jgi:NADH-quinone oxidoreductase subunit C